MTPFKLDAFETVLLMFIVTVAIFVLGVLLDVATEHKPWRRRRKR
jgi:hypothetical protein